MSDRGEMWVHGNAVVIQYPGGDGEEFTAGRRMKKVIDPNTGATVPWSDLLGFRAGPHAIFRGRAGNSNWFHFSIPTPAVVPDLEATGRNLGIAIDAVSMYFATPSQRVNIDLMFIFNGSTGKIVEQVGPPMGHLLYGQHLDTHLEGTNFFRFNNAVELPADVLGPKGVLLSVQVRFEEEGDITFGPAGIHYHVI